MGLRQRQWANRRASQLKFQLGGRCAEYGEDDYEKLEFDHLEPREWDHRQVERSHRISIIAREIREGKVRLLCRSCNARKGKPQAAACEPIPD